MARRAESKIVQLRAEPEHAGTPTITAFVGQALGKYTDAPEAEAIARELIEEVPEHQHLVNARLRFLFRAGSWVSRGQTVFGRAFVLSERDRLLSGVELLVILNGEKWPELTPEQQRALIDHELCHFTQDEEGRWKLAAHDVEEFAAVIRRHGLWTEELRTVGRVVQERLPLEAVEA